MKLYTTLMSFLLADRPEDRGASAVEYTLLLAGIAVVVAGLVLALRGPLTSAWDSITGSIGGGD